MAQVLVLIELWLLAGACLFLDLLLLALLLCPLRLAPLILFLLLLLAG